MDQENRRRGSDQIRVMYKGKQRYLAELAREHGIDPTQAGSRYRHGWTVERILTTPILKRGGYRKRDSGGMAVSACKTYPDCFHCPYPDCWVNGAHKGELMDIQPRQEKTEGFFEHQYKVASSALSRRKAWM